SVFLSMSHFMPLTSLILVCLFGSIIMGDGYRENVAVTAEIKIKIKIKTVLTPLLLSKKV
ncbi:unnamed protein product, partial [marine sediment metagenome]